MLYINFFYISGTNVEKHYCAFLGKLNLEYLMMAQTSTHIAFITTRISFKHIWVNLSITATARVYRVY